jgi:hypothetical protein
VWLKGLLALVIAVFVVELALNPWTFHIGDRFTPLTQWDGYGTVRASNGGRYVLFTHLQGAGVGSACSLTGCDTLRGSAKICTERGSTYSLQLTGSVHAWWSTDGARTFIEFRSARPGLLPAGWMIAFKGSWHGPRLVITDTDNSFTQILTARGAIRHAAVTADTGNAAVTLRYGSSAAFSKACRALAA